MSGRISVPEIAVRLTVGRVAVYSMLEQGIIPAVRIGKRWIVSHASLLLADGVDIATVSERLGHSSVRTTTEIYSHATGTIETRRGKMTIATRMYKGHPCYAPDYDHAAVAKHMRRQARTGFLRGPGQQQSNARYIHHCTCGVNLWPAPNSVSLMLMRDYLAGAETTELPPGFGKSEDGWHFSICCVTDCGYRGYQPEEGEHWLDLIFGQYGERVTIDYAAESVIGTTKGVHHFILPCDWTDRNDPAVELEGLP